MSRNQIAVCTSDADFLATLRGHCPDRTFADFRDSLDAGVIIVDGSFQGEVPSAGRSRVRILLEPAAVAQPRGFGDLRLEREVFLGSVEEFLGIAGDLSMTMQRGADLEQEVDLFAEVRDLMLVADPDLVFEKITQSALTILRLPAGALLVHDPRLDRFIVAYATDRTAPSPSDESNAALQELARQAVRDRRTWLLGKTAEGLSMIAVPLEIGGEVLGFFTATVPSGLEVSDAAASQAARYIRAVRGVVAHLHQLTRSRDLAMLDDLTKAFNRRFFDSYLDEEIERARRYGSFFSIIFLDLDDLKLVNNRHGHLMGSRVLQEVARRILGAVRNIDKVVRFGGDEFCIIMPQTDQVQASLVAGRVRKSLIQSSFHSEPDIEIPIAASFGIATYPYHALSKEDLIRQADDAMYRVKSSTKNAIGLAGESAISRTGAPGEAI